MYIAQPSGPSFDTKCNNRVTICALCLQWFGNLVTMEWWNDLWLNEGFATFMENLAMKIVFPDLYTVSAWRIGGFAYFSCIIVWV